MSSRQASNRAVPTPFFLAFGSTPVGPKKLRHVASWQANPMILLSWVAMKHETGWRVGQIVKLDEHVHGVTKVTQNLADAMTLCLLGVRLGLSDPPGLHGRFGPRKQTCPRCVARRMG